MNATVIECNSNLGCRQLNHKEAVWMRFIDWIEMKLTLKHWNIFHDLSLTGREPQIAPGGLSPA